MTRRLLTLLLIIPVNLVIFSQDIDDPRYQAYIEKYGSSPALTYTDSIFLINVPEIHAGPSALREELPPIVDNSTLPYLRPVFQQYGPSCGQAASIGYNFTYEINHARGLPADTSVNQYATHFTWNFMNGGNGWYGVSYYHSFEIVKKCGNPNVEDYGGYFFDDGRRWMTGYDLYYNSMQNRIDGMYQIKTNTEEGILTLKNWLFNHLGTSDEGGIGCFYANVPYNTQKLPDGTPEAGKEVLTAWYPVPSHAMNIVGYNDSIRWDYNGDGQYTNHLDINNDGIIDPKDWEIGGVKCVNSHGDDAQDSGFYYMMYKVLAEEYMNGSIWNNAVNIVKADPDYSPEMTLKIELKHDYRQAIRVRAGISVDTNDAFPEHIMSFPIFNFQGGEHFMQGQDTAEYLKTIEFGLDITPLLGFAEPGMPARFYIVIDESDPYNRGTGKLMACSLMDYHTTLTETSFNNLPATLEENGQSVYSVVYNPNFEDITILTEELDPFIPGEAYEAQLQAMGGRPPYSWSLVHDYIQVEDLADGPVVDELALMPNAQQDTIVSVPLEFSFPFYGKRYDTIKAHVDGYLLFGDDILPWPYNRDQELLISKNRMIGPFVQRDFIIDEADDGVWFEGSDSVASFRWNLTMGGIPPLDGPFTFAASLYPDGRIRFYYDHVNFPANLRVASGISAGDGSNYKMSRITDPVSPGTLIEFIPREFPASLNIGDDGLLQGTPEDGSKIYDITVRATDRQRISEEKTLTMTTGPMISFNVHAGDDDIVEYGEEVTLDLTLKNISDDPINNILINLEINDPYITVNDPSWFAGNLGPGEEITEQAALSFHVDYAIPDKHILFLETQISSAVKNWSKEMVLEANAPVLEMISYEIADEDGKLDPGETSDMIIFVQNKGHATASMMEAELSSTASGITINGNPIQFFGNIDKGQMAAAVYNVTAGSSIAMGTKALFTLDMNADHGISASNEFNLLIGKIPVAVIDLDPNFHSGPVIFETLSDMGILCDYETSINNNIDDYQCLFICLGIHYSNHELSEFEGQVLADYLDAGGRIYMEGRKAWRDDPFTALRPKFRILPEGTVTVFDTIRGIPGSFTEGMSFSNEAQYPFNYYWIKPWDTAFPIFEGGEDSVTCSVAFETDVYKTIGGIFEFSAMGDLEGPSTKTELMQRYLDFFGVQQYIVNIVQPLIAEASGSITVYPNPARSKVKMRVEIEGEGRLEVKVYDLRGCLIKRLFAGKIYQGETKTLTWDGNSESGTPVNQGVYFYRAILDDKMFTGKIVLIP